MKQLILSRHANTEPMGYNINDFERMLTNGGINDSRLMSSYLYEKKIETELIISSPANRAMATAIIYANCFKIPLNKIVEVDQLYDGFSTQEFLGMLQKKASRNSKVWVFGHNPDIANWAAQLLNKDCVNMPAGTAIFIDFNVKDWIDIDARSGNLINYITPTLVRERLAETKF